MTDQTTSPQPGAWDHDDVPIMPMPPERRAAQRADADAYKEKMQQTEMVLTTPDSFIPKPDLPLEEPTHDWDIEPWTKNGLPIPPERYDAIAAHGKGWKMHLNFDYTDPAVVASVGVFLTGLKHKGVIHNFKIGQGGGAEAGEDAAGKEATVYIGAKDKAQAGAEQIAEGLSDVLLDPAGAVLVDDTPFAGKVWGRFELGGLDDDFMYYGKDGYSLLEKDAFQITNGGMRYAGLEGQAAKQAFDTDARAHAKELLAYRYGEFFTGTQAPAS